MTYNPHVLTTCSQIQLLRLGAVPYVSVTAEKVITIRMLGLEIPLKSATTDNLKMTFLGYPSLLFV